MYGGDLNVFPRPDDPIAMSDSDTPSDQLGPLYEAGLRNLWENLLADAPSAAYSYTFQGQAQTLDHLFVNPALYGDLVQMRAAHINAGWPADFDGDGPRGVSDHDPQVARFRSRATLTVADVSAWRRATPAPRRRCSRSRCPGRCRSRSLVCAVTIGLTAADPSDYDGLAQCQLIQPGTTSLTFTVNVRGDRRREADETVRAAGDRGPVRPAGRPGRHRHHPQRRLIGLSRKGPFLTLSGIEGALPNAQAARASRNRRPVTLVGPGTIPG